MAYADHPNCHQGHQPQSGMVIIIITPATSAAMSSIFENDLDAFKFNKFQPNFKLSFLRTNVNHSNHDQGHQPQSGMSIVIITPATTATMSLIFESDLDAFKLNRFQPNLNSTNSWHMQTLQIVLKDTSPSQEW